MVLWASKSYNKNMFLLTVLDSWRTIFYLCHVYRCFHWKRAKVPCTTVKGFLLSSTNLRLQVHPKTCPATQSLPPSFVLPHTKKQFQLTTRLCSKSSKVSYWNLPLLCACLACLGEWLYVQYISKCIHEYTIYIYRLCLLYFVVCKHPISSRLSCPCECSERNCKTIIKQQTNGRKNVLLSTLWGFGSTLLPKNLLSQYIQHSHGCRWHPQQEKSHVSDTPIRREMVRTARM